jgi:sugar-specific transcriptional regulator TrmB
LGCEDLAKQIQIKNGKRKSELMKDELELLPVYTQSTNRASLTQEAIDHIQALKNIDQALSKFKLSKNETRVYLYLARFGAHKAQSIAESLGVHRTEAYKILKRLESQGLITKIMERPMKFVAVPFEQVLENLIEERRQRIRQMEQRKAELLHIWKSLPEPANVNKVKETFQVLEGKRHISVRINELLSACTEKFDLILSDQNIIWLYNTSFFDELEEMAERDEVEIRLLTNYSPTSNYVLERLNMEKGDFAYLKGYAMPGFLICDEKEMILLMDDQTGLNGMWTNYQTIIQSYIILFNLLWKEK